VSGTYHLYNMTDLEPGHHACFIYGTGDEHRAVMTQYLKLGLERGEQVLYIADAHTPGNILKYLQDNGLDVEPNLSSGQLSIISAAEVCFRDGSFDYQRIIDVLWSERGRALAAGYTALRVTIEMTWLLREQKGAKELVEYESRLNRFFPAKKGFGNCVAVCQFDRRRFQAEQLLDALSTHPLAIIGREIHDNFYYLIPEKASEHEQSAALLRHNLEKLEERRRAEAQLRGDEARYRGIYEQSPIGIALYDSGGKLVVANKACLKIFGVNEAADVGGFNLFNNLDMARNVKEKLGDSSSVRIETTFDFSRVNFLKLVDTSKSGLVHLDVTVTDLGRGEKSFKGLYLVHLQDVTKRKQAEKMLQKSEDRFRSVIEAASDAIISCDSSDNIISWNSSAEAMFYYSSDVMIGRPFTSIIAAPYRKTLNGRVKKLLSNPGPQEVDKPVELAGLRKNGAEFPVEVSLARWRAGSGLFFTAVVRDITERRRAEGELRINKGAMDCSINAIAMVDLKGDITYVNRSFLRMWGYESHEEILGKEATRFWQSPANATRTIISITGKGWVGELLARKKDGSTFSVQLSSSIVTDETGSKVCVLASFVKIDESRKPDSDLDDIRERYRALTEYSTDLIFMVNGNGRFLYANQASAGYFLSETGDLAGRNLAEVLQDAEANEMLKNIKRVLGQDEAMKAYGNFSRGRLTGYFSTTLAPVRNESGEAVAVLAVAHDISDFKEKETKLQELYRQERELRKKIDLETRQRAEFTRALVHEIKNRLTPVLASSDLLASEMEDEPWLSLARNVSRGAANLNERIEELLDLARGETGLLELRTAKISIADLLRDVARETIPATSDRMQQLILSLPDTLPPVHADESRIRQVVMNLVGNACKFTPAGGVITLTAREEEENVVVEVHDTGTGLSGEVQRRLFQPYHRIDADREYLSGLGLGLALSRKLVEMHGGSIWVENGRRKGNVFGFSIPLGKGNKNNTLLRGT
jgi:PAS domain S-box-containing protein